MRKVPLGNTGLEVSALCLGGVGFGWRLDRDVSYQLLDHYYEAGGRFIDTANIYSEGNTSGDSETLIGNWVRDRKNRDGLVLASKVGLPYDGVEKGLKASQILEECEKSLARLQTDCIDLYYAHADDRNTSCEETLSAFDNLVKAGKVRHLGASNFEADRLAESQGVSKTHDWAAYCALQQRHTYLQPKADAKFRVQVWLKPEIEECCRANNMTILAYSSTLKGAYSGRKDRPIDKDYQTAENEARLAVLDEVVNETGATHIQVVLAWLLQGESSILPMCGASSVEQLDEKFAALNITLSEDQMTRLGR